MDNNAALAAALILIAVVIGYIELQGSGAPASQQIAASNSSAVYNATAVALKLGKYQQAHELAGISGYINAPQNFTLASQVGSKVVLLDFWTYSCINCLRTIPYLNAWYAKYHAYGLEIVGVHTPEFDFEKVYSNVQAAVQKLGIKYPVVLDSDYGTWSAYQNQYWPHEYLIDIDGFIVHDQVGEGGYTDTEDAIRNALAERLARLNQSSTQLPQGYVNPLGIQVPLGVQTPETYFGAERNEFLANGQPGAQGSQTLSVPSQTQLNGLYLGGSWNFLQQYAQTQQAGAKIVMRYFASNVFFVASANSSVQIEVTRDGLPLGSEAGADITAQGNTTSTTVQLPRLYRLIEDKSGPGEHEIEITVKNPGLQAFTFTFG